MYMNIRSCWLVLTLNPVHYHMVFYWIIVDKSSILSNGYIRHSFVVPLIICMHNVTGIVHSQTTFGS